MCLVVARASWPFACVVVPGLVDSVAEHSTKQHKIAVVIQSACELPPVSSAICCEPWLGPLVDRGSNGFWHVTGK